jgi:hypothetical protein
VRANTGPKNIHVANIIVHCPIDGGRLNHAFPYAKEKRPIDGMVNVDTIAETFWQVLTQPRTAGRMKSICARIASPFDDRSATVDYPA